MNTTIIIGDPLEIRSVDKKKKKNLSKVNKSEMDRTLYGAYSLKYIQQRVAGDDVETLLT